MGRHDDGQELWQGKSKKTSAVQPVKVSTVETGINAGEPTGRVFAGSAGSSVGSDGHGPLRPPRGLNKFSRPSYQQRLFPSNPRDVGHRTRVTAESPPSDSVGFFFGLTPPDNQR